MLFVRQGAANSKVCGWYVDILGGKKIVEYSLILKPQADRS